MGEKVLGVRLEGNPKKPEPEHFRIVFPGGDMEVARTTDNDYWIHVRVNHPDHGMFVKGEDVPGKILNARLDLTDRNTVDADVGDFNNPALYHLAVRVTTKQGELPWEAARERNGRSFWTALHSHRHGNSIYVVESDHQPSEEEVVKVLGIDFEPGRNETIDIDGPMSITKLKGGSKK